MRRLLWLSFAWSFWHSSIAAQAQSVLFDFDTAPLHSPLPIDLTVDGVTAHLASSSLTYNYSVQRADALGFTPVGFAGQCIYPGSVFASDLLISFNKPLSTISLDYAPEEYATDSSATMRLTAYQGASLVGTTTYNAEPGTWPTGTLSFTSAQTFDHVVVHYDQPPVTGGDYGPIFMADNLRVTAVPEPSTIVFMVSGGVAMAAILYRRARRWRKTVVQISNL